MKSKMKSKRDAHCAHVKINRPVGSMADGARMWVTGMTLGRRMDVVQMCCRRGVGSTVV